MARYFLRGRTTVYFVTSIAATTAPTSTEINTGGTNLKGDLCDFNGFLLSNDQIDTPDLATSFDSKIDGRDQVGDSSLTFYDSDAGTHPARTAMPKGTNGFLVFARYPTPATKRCEVWPSRVTFVTDQWQIGQEAAKFQIGYAVTSVPIQNATFPSGVSI